MSLGITPIQNELDADVVNPSDSTTVKGLEWVDTILGTAPSWAIFGMFGLTIQSNSKLKDTWFYSWSGMLTMASIASVCGASVIALKIVITTITDTKMRDTVRWLINVLNLAYGVTIALLTAQLFGCAKLYGGIRIGG